VELCWGCMTSERGEGGSYMHTKRWTLDSDWVHGGRVFGRSAGLLVPLTCRIATVQLTAAAVCCCRLLISLTAMHRI
jgi:hypothetical protein